MPRSRTTRSAVARSTAAGLLALLAGCAAGPEGAASTEGTHTMPDGTVMEGPTHVHDDSHDHGGEQSGSGASDEAGPSAAARMVCDGQVVDDVTRILELDGEVTSRTSWAEPTFRCTFDVPDGALVLTVHDVDDEAAGMAHFQQVRTSHPDATPLKGVYGLGLPAYETEAGTVSFVKDGKTLEVDATALPARGNGVEGAMTRTEIAYAVATSVLTCWTEHG